MNKARRAPPNDDDMALVARIGNDDPLAFTQLMRRYNTALFRSARAILRDDAEAEDALQDAYLAAYRHLSEFRGEARLETWLTRIVINQALGRLRARRRGNVIAIGDPGAALGPDTAELSMGDTSTESPESTAMRAQLRRLLERKIDELPLGFRTAFILREVQEMTIDEAAACLGVAPATVRTRVFRARALLRASLAEEMDLATGDVFAFAGARCDRVVASVLARLEAESR